MQERRLYQAKQLRKMRGRIPVFVFIILVTGTLLLYFLVFRSFPEGAVKLSVSELPWVQRGINGLTINNQPFRFIGVNTIYFGFYDEYDLAIEGAVKSAKETGIDVIRIYLWVGDGPWGYGTLQEYDKVLDIAFREGLYVIVTLTDCCPGDWGQTKESYLRAVPHCDVTSQYGLKSFKRHIKRILTRKNTINGRIYRDDSTILAWDIANEPQLAYFDPGAVHSWLREVVSYTKRLDPNHLVTVGIAAGGEEYDSDGIHYKIFDVPGIDFFSFHFYPPQRYSKKKIFHSGNYLDSLSYRIRRFIAMNRPVLFGEFGFGSQREIEKIAVDGSDAVTVANWLKAYRDSMETAFTAGASGVMFWGWGVPETRNIPLWWKYDDHDITEEEFCTLIREYKITPSQRH